MRITPETADLTQLHTLWKDVFGDEDGYIDLFFSGAFHTSHPFAVIENGEVQSVLYLLDCQLQAGKQRYDGYYLYAAATKPQYRRRGLMRTLIEEAKAYMHESGKDFIVLVPATKPLYDYYEHFGFQTKLYRWAGTFAAPEKPPPISSRTRGTLPSPPGRTTAFCGRRTICCTRWSVCRFTAHRHSRRTVSPFSSTAGPSERYLPKPRGTRSSICLRRCRKTSASPSMGRTPSRAFKDSPTGCFTAPTARCCPVPIT